MARWNTPGLGAREGKFLDLIAESPKDFYEFVEHCFGVKGGGSDKDKGKGPYTARRRTIDGQSWIIINDPILDKRSVLGMKINSPEAEDVIKRLTKECRIKVQDG